MKNKKLTGMRAFAVSVVASGATLLPVLAQPIVVPYTFTPADVLAHVSGMPGHYPNNGATTVNAADPNTTVEYTKNLWDSTVQVKNSLKAREDGMVPAGYLLESIKVSYTLVNANWLAFDNEDATPKNNVSFDWTIKTGLIRDFQNVFDPFTNEPLPTGGGSLIDSISNSLTGGPFALASDEVADGAPDDNPAVDFPFALGFGGPDAYVAAPHAAGQAYTPLGTGEQLVDPFGVTLNKPAFDLVGVEFTAFTGTDPATTIPVTIYGYDSITLSSALGVTAAYRAMSYGSFTIQYTFVPEAETWSAGMFLATVAAGFGLNRWRVRS